MKKYLSLIVAFGILINPFKASAYTGEKSSEVRMTFKAFVETDPGAKKPTASEAQAMVDDHVNYLFGPMMLMKTMAAPKGDEQTRAFKPLLQKSLAWRVNYSYQGTFVMKNGPVTHYTVILPNNPQALFDKTFKSHKKNPCTDETYQLFSDFWYFWSPFRPHCGELIKEGVDYQVIDAKLERIPNIKNSRPEYERLADKKGVIQIVMMMGLDDPYNASDPISSEGHKNDDLNAANYRQMKKALEKIGFESKEWTHPEIRKIVKTDVNPLPHVEELVKKYNGNRANEIRVTLFFGKSGIDQASTAFHYFLKYGIEKSAVMIYDGHSGLGSNLYLPEIEKELSDLNQKRVRFTPNKDRYQIYFFNSCSSYDYYNEMFFKRKHQANKDPRGTKNLDIITTGLEAPFDGAVEVDLDLISSIDSWVERGTKIGYKTLIHRMENDDLTGVNGDEDNPTTQD